MYLWSPEEFGYQKNIEHAGYAFYYGMLIVMMVYNLFLYFFVKHISYLYYVAYIISFTAFQFTLNGYSFQFLWPNSPGWADTALPFSQGLTGGFLMLFSITFLRTPHYAPRMNIVLVSTAVLCFLSTPLSLVLPSQNFIRAKFCFSQTFPDC